VKLARSIDEVKSLATEILGMQLITHQTGPLGQKVRRLLIEDGADIKKEYYVSAVTDRATQRVAMIVSSEGGMDIEGVAHDTPEKIITEIVDPALGLTDSQAKKLSDAIGVPAASTAQAVDVLQKLYKTYMDTDASLVEINPLILEGNGNIKALEPSSILMPTLCSATPISWPFATLTKKTRLRLRPANSTSPTLA
ncbi:MAG: Succinyl-CoA ligase [ADP-forming] subunit beta, partial [Pseudomonadota bacterium]